MAQAQLKFEMHELRIFVAIHTTNSTDYRNGTPIYDWHTCKHTLRQTNKLQKKHVIHTVTSQRIRLNCSYSGDMSAVVSILQNLMAHSHFEFHAIPYEYTQTNGHRSEQCQVLM